MKRVAVVAHAGKTLDGGLAELRRELAVDGITAPDLVRGAEEQEGAEAGAAGRSKPAPSS